MDQYIAGQATDALNAWTGQVTKDECESMLRQIEQMMAEDGKNDRRIVQQPATRVSERIPYRNKSN